MPLVELEDIRLYYEEHGRGPALMLAHGHACGVRSWDRQLRGWGAVTKLTGRASMSMFATSP